MGYEPELNDPIFYAEEYDHRLNALSVATH
jgi:hypothetical protein